MRAALQLLPARTSAPRFGEPTRLVPQHLFTTNAGLLDQKGAFGALDIVRVALVFDLRMSTLSATRAGKSALWGLSSALPIRVNIVNRLFGANRINTAGNVLVGEGRVWCGHRSS